MEARRFAPPLRAIGVVRTPYTDRGDTPFQPAFAPGIEGEVQLDPRYVDVANRTKHKGEIVNMIEEWLARMPSDEEAVDVLRAHRVPVAPVLSISEAMNHPHLRRRGSVRKVQDRILGEFEIPGFPLRFSRFPDELEFEAPLLGEHNEAVLTRYLGYTKERVSQLVSEGVLHSAPY